MTTNSRTQLISEYLNDVFHFSNKAELAYSQLDQHEPILYGGEFYGQMTELEQGTISTVSNINLRDIRYCIIAAFQFLDAFITLEYLDVAKDTENFDYNFSSKLQQFAVSEVELSFEQKWSIFLAQLLGEDVSEIENDHQFNKLKNLALFRNQLTFYLIDNKGKVPEEIHCIENSRFARWTVVETINWYYEKTGKEMPEWIAIKLFNNCH